MNLYIVNSRWLDLYISTRWIGLGVCISPKHKTFHINILILRMTLYFGGKRGSMTIVERNNKLKNYIACLKCEVSGKVGKHCDDSCPTQYEAGNMGEIIENLEAISRVLEQEDSDKISYTNGDKILKDYPKATTRICKNKGFTYIEVEKDDKWIGDFSIEWWKSEYKE